MDAKEKGTLGEAKVFKIIDSALKSLGFDYKIFQNARFPFESVYGERGLITAEIDIVVFTPYLVFLFEVKNELYEKFGYKEPLWKLYGGEEVSNPIEQNHTHKEVFCSELKIPREQVITVEVLLENGYVPNAISPYPNDYIFSEYELTNKLIYLLATTSEETIKVEQAYQQFTDLLAKKYISEEEHISYLKRTEKIETRIINVIGYINLHRTDVVYCPSCGVGKLYFRNSKHLSTRESKKKSDHYGLGCSTYGKGNVNCDVGLIYVDKYKDSTPFKNINPESIASRNNWGEEKVTKTILDEIEKLNAINQDLRDELNMLDNENSKLKKELTENRRINDKYAIEVMHLTKEKEQYDQLKEKVCRFKKVFGRIYIYKG